MRKRSILLQMSLLMVCFSAVAQFVEQPHVSIAILGFDQYNGMAIACKQKPQGRFRADYAFNPDPRKELIFSGPSFLWTISPIIPDVSFSPADETMVDVNLSGNAFGKNYVVSVIATWIVWDNFIQNFRLITARGSVELVAIRVETETVATTPADKSRKKVGVGEKVTLTLKPTSLNSVSWTIEPTLGNGTLSTTTGNPVIFTAQDRVSEPSITATYGGASDSVTFKVVEPDDQIIEQESGTGIMHIFGRPSVGFKGRAYIQPTDVSFDNIEVRERAAAAVCDGYFTYQNGEPHLDQEWRTVGAVVAGKGSRVECMDIIQGGTDQHTPYVYGTFTWAIPREFKVGTGAAKQFKIVPQKKTIDATGKLTISKGGTTVSKELNDPDSNY